MLDVNKMPVLDEDGNSLTLPPALTIDGVPGCHRSYLTYRELWLINWGEMNPQCKQCTLWHNQSCKQPAIWQLYRCSLSSYKGPQNDAIGLFRLPSSSPEYTCPNAAPPAWP